MMLKSLFGSTLAKVAGGVGLALLIVIGFQHVSLNSKQAKIDALAERNAALQESNDQLTASLERMETANDARKDIAKPGPVGDCTRYAQCVRSARTPANCLRLLPERDPDQCGG